MIKPFYLIPLLALMVACSGGNKQTEKSEEAIQDRIEAIEESMQDLDTSIESSEHKMKKKQRKIDSLLKNI